MFSGLRALSLAATMAAAMVASGTASAADARTLSGTALCLDWLDVSSEHLCRCGDLQLVANQPAGAQASKPAWRYAPVGPAGTSGWAGAGGAPAPVQTAFIPDGFLPNSGLVGGPSASGLSNSAAPPLSNGPQSTSTPGGPKDQGPIVPAPSQKQPPAISGPPVTGGGTGDDLLEEDDLEQVIETALPLPPVPENPAPIASPQVTQVPEPSSILLLLGLGGLLCGYRFAAGSLRPARRTDC
ncbi:MAG: PEP-CTERM sorting domain-containing protein [Tistlia sp.]|uniref:PEP-CTERM sorting domain-containing protein n=1 Tax=Tistlia sp. TaxID=3057121 RepID=UPI0034A130EC